jgi:hypothetical protein
MSALKTSKDFFVFFRKECTENRKLAIRLDQRYFVKAKMYFQKLFQVNRSNFQSVSIRFYIFKRIIEKEL